MTSSLLTQHPNQAKRSLGEAIGITGSISWLFYLQEDKNRLVRSPFMVVSARKLAALSFYQLHTLTLKYSGQQVHFVLARFEH